MTEKERLQKDGKLCVYKFENLINGKIYIGSGYEYRRKGQHKWKLRNNIHDSKIFQADWNQYGESNFVFSVLEYVVNKDERFIKEQYYMDLLEVLDSDKGYNKAPIAGSNIGTTRSPEARKKMSIAKTGVKFSKEVIARRILSQYKKVYQYDINGNFIKEFISMQHAALEIKRSYTTISKALNSESRTAGSFKWKDIKK